MQTNCPQCGRVIHCRGIDEGEPVKCDDCVMQEEVESPAVRDGAAEGYAILKAKWDEMQPGRYQTAWEDECDSAWMNGFEHAMNMLRDRAELSADHQR